MDTIVVTTLNPHGLLTSDIADVNALLRELSPESPQLSEEQLSKIAQPETFYVARLNGYSVVGMATLAISYRKSGQIGIIENFVVTPKRRRQGVGKKMMAKLVQDARFLKLNAIELVTLRENPAAQFYRALRFAEEDATYFTLKLQ
ncbi:MAG TPA: GNAT family N-acetyltransferase [Candidatus Paceibacterota bacterium]|nr:GNAT family N-acetyltransferase [Candidatus Paceibacterota bacterium]